MKKNTLIYLAIAAAGYAYFQMMKKKKSSINENKPMLPRQIEVIEKKVRQEPALITQLPVRQEPRIIPQLPAFTYNPKTTILPVAKTLDTIKNAIFLQPSKPFTLNPAGAATKQKAAKKQKAKKAKLGQLGASYLFV
jgi:hypothetical protein